MSEWIKIEDQVPPRDREVLACFKGQFKWVVFVATSTLHDGVFRPGYAPPTHWQPLPVPPEEA